MNKEFKELSNQEIIKRIKDIIIARHPIMEDRFDKITDYPTPVIDININFLNSNNEDFTVISFCNGNERAKVGIPERIYIKGLIEPDTINELISEILLDHDYIFTASLTETKMSIIFGVNLREDNMHGISCNEIGLNIETKNHFRG